MFEQLTRIFTQTHPNLNFTSISLEKREDFVNLSLGISEILPRLSVSEIHQLCLEQEIKVMNRIISIKPIDLYEEIGNACHGFKGLQKMSIDQVKTKIIELTSNIEEDQSVNEESKVQVVQVTEQDQNDISNSNENVYEDLPEMNLFQETISTNNKIEFEKDIDNMFAQQPHTDLPWTSFGLYDIEMSE